jgi:hypothetical protein
MRKRYCLGASALLVVAFAAYLCWETAYSADCMTKGAQGPCSLQVVEGYCNTRPEGNDCHDETEPTQTSPECGETKQEKTPYMVCISACPHVINCEQSATPYSFGKIYYCYCKDDWGTHGSCTLYIVETCWNYPYVDRGPC